MSTIPNLWPPDILADVRTPAAILMRQASALETQTNGLLTAYVATIPWTDDRVRLWFEIYAPSLSFQTRVLTVEHGAGSPYYPVTVWAREFGGPADGSAWTGDDRAAADAEPESRVAPDEPEFLDLVRRALASTSVRTLVFDLLARMKSPDKAHAPPAA